MTPQNTKYKENHTDLTHLLVLIIIHYFQNMFPTKALFHKAVRHAENTSWQIYLLCYFGWKPVSVKQYFSVLSKLFCFYALFNWAHIHIIHVGNSTLMDQRDNFVRQASFFVNHNPHLLLNVHRPKYMTTNLILWLSNIPFPCRTFLPISVDIIAHVHVTNNVIVQSVKSNSNVSLGEGFDDNVIEIWDVMNFQQGLIISTEPDFLMLNYLTCLKGHVAFGFGVLCYRKFLLWKE